MSGIIHNPLPSKEQQNLTPSQKDGINSDLEDQFRHVGCELIQSAGILLRLPQVAMSTAQILFHRFYFMASLKSFPIRDIGMGALLLASKVEECTITLRDLINVYHFLMVKRRNLPYEPMNLYGDTYYEMRDAICDSEVQILKYLGFNVAVQLPYGIMVNYLGALGLADHSTIPQRAWNHLNDVMRSRACVCFTTEQLACGAIHLAVAVEDVFVPMRPKPWWEIFDSSEEDVLALAAAIEKVHVQQRDLKEARVPLTQSETQAFFREI